MCSVTLPAAARLAQLRAVGSVDPALRVAHEEQARPCACGALGRCDNEVPCMALLVRVRVRVRVGVRVRVRVRVNPSMGAGAAIYYYYYYYYYYD